MLFFLILTASLTASNFPLVVSLVTVPCSFAPHSFEQQFLEKVTEAIVKKRFKCLTLIPPKTKRVLGSSGVQTVQKVTSKMVTLKGTEAVHFSLRVGAQEFHRNVKVGGGVEAFVEQCLRGEPLPGLSFATKGGKSAGLTAKLQTTSGEHTMLKLFPGSSAKFFTSKAAIPSTQIKSQAHDEMKARPIDTKQPFLRALGMTTPEGITREKMSSKLKQCQQFVNVVGPLVTKLIGADPGNCVEVLDMGSGKGYLTFCLHAYLANFLASTNSPTRLNTTGVEQREALVVSSNAIVKELRDVSFEGLKFVEGEISSLFGSAVTNPNQETTNRTKAPLRVLISLHACNTATCDTIAYGIQTSADLIVVSPCCHREVRSQFRGWGSTAGGAENGKGGGIETGAGGEALNPVWQKHGIFAERFAEILSDSLRCQLLRASGYKVTVSEFVGVEHSGKNLLVVAQKRKVLATEEEKDNTRKAKAEIRTLLDGFGIATFRLADLLGL